MACKSLDDTMKPVAVIIGRPNVGKSTLFNRIVGLRSALVDNMPGVTRDRNQGETKWNDCEFVLVDTGGFLSSDDDYFAKSIKEQLIIAAKGADALIFVMDGRQGLFPYDKDVAVFLRKFSKPVFYLVNKIESPSQKDYLGEFYSLGIDFFYVISAEHGIGIEKFLDDLVLSFPFKALKKEEKKDKEETIKIAIAGRPNSGKSCLANRLFGEKRLIVDKKAGTTRDSIELEIKYKKRLFKLIDTAGIRRKGKTTKKIEKISIIKSLQSLDKCDVALILIDSEEKVTDQDITIAGYANDKGCAVIFLFNKWDLVKNKDKNIQNYVQDLRYKAKFLSYAPAITISALTGQRCERILDEVIKVYKEYCYRINTGTLNRIVEEAVFRKQPSLHKSKRLKFYYCTQVSTKPPCFICFVNYPQAVHFSYKRYLINQLRQMIPLKRTSLKLYFKEKSGRIDFSFKKKPKSKTRKNKK